MSDLKKVWDNLYENNPLLSPYQSYEFCKTVVSDYRLSHLRVFLTPVFFEIQRDGEPIIIVPLWKRPIKKPPFKEYYLFPDFCLAGYLDVVYRSDCDETDFRNALYLVRDKIKARLTLRRVNEDSAFCQYLLSHYESYGNAPCALVSFPDGFDAYFSSLGKQMRQNVRTARNRMRRDGKTYELKVVARTFFDDALWNDVLRIHLKRKLLRDGIHESGVRNYVERNHDPMERAIRNVSFNALFMLMIDGVGAAYFVGFITNDGKTIVVPRLAIDDDFKFYSPGIVLIAEAVQYLCDNTEVRAIDLCHGDQSYKYAMGAHARTNYYFEIPYREK